MKILELEQKLNAKNINPTAMRILVLDHLLQQKSALSLTDIEKGMNPADRITIYRTLKTFAEKGLVHVVNDGIGSPKYALCLEGCDASKHQDLHVHFYCDNCKNTCCLPNTTVPSIALPKGFSSLEMNLVVRGICKDCSI